MPSSRRSVLTACTAGIGALAGCLSSENPTADGSWPRRTLTNAHTGYASTDGPTADLYTVWQQERARSGGVTPSPVVDDGVLYVTYSRQARDDERGGAWVEAFDAATGDSQWTTELFRTEKVYSLDHSDSTVVDGDRLFTQTDVGLTMLTTDGEIQWTVDNFYNGQLLPDAAPPVVTDDVVVAGTYGTQDEDGQNEVVYGVDPETGDERWRTSFDDWSGMWQLAGTGDVVYVPFDRTGLVALDVTSGEERWRWEGPVDGTPTVVDDLILVALRRDDEDVLGALDRRDRSLRWEASIEPRWPSAGFAVAGELCYHASYFGLEARRLETGERAWRFGPEEGERPHDEPQVDLVTTPVVADDAVYVSGWIQRDTMYGHLFVVDSATGEELGRAEMGRNQQAGTGTPAVTSDLVFLGSEHGTLYAFGECSFEVADRCLSG
ncbi:PQQ-binding-like beta-propeller repeat protein [Halostagnicola kamekurae]|uniref:Outer membrane protein assembly factor BamB n=1 Tax=Halostagnicola kamekurae TaxID=619731 RepID=A0A1I6PIT0_9EURY|nr:PQQ-binding-like beta-propeller repeat protein [Halostagnicola kamekurae]SFS40087.1 outer membrane protein assembly factor BamB [Halostagnicola kamekurae]